VLSLVSGLLDLNITGEDTGTATLSVVSAGITGDLTVTVTGDG